MQDVLTEMSEKWNNALVNAAQNRFGTKGQQQENAQQAETTVENAVENTETVNTEQAFGKTEELTETTQPVQEETESKLQPIAGRHIDQRTTDSVKGVDMDLFSSEGDQIQIGFAEAAKILLADLNSTIRGDRTFVSDGGADQTVLGQKRMTSALLEEIKDQTGWTWEHIGKSLRAFALAGKTDDLVKNMVTNRTMELYLNEMLTEGYTTLEGVKLTPWGEYVDFVQGLEGAKEHTVREAKDAIPFEDYAFADVEEAENVKYSMRSFDDQVDELVNGTFPRNDHLYLMDTPDVLVQAGLERLPMLMTQKHAKSVMKVSGKDNVNYHGLTKAGLKQLPNAIANASLVIRAPGYNNRVIAFTDMKDSAGNTVITPIQLNGRGNWQDVEISANILTTAYGKNNVKDMIFNAIMNDDVLYLDKKRSYALGKTVGVQFPKNLTSEASTNSIRASSQNSNRKSTNEDVKFSLRDAETDRRYMTAVENGDTETAQRMVDEAAEEAFKNSEIRQRAEDGEWVFKYFGEGPLVKVHHKTDAEFNVFSMDKLGQNTSGNASTEALEATAYLGWRLCSSMSSRSSLTRRNSSRTWEAAANRQLPMDGSYSSRTGPLTATSGLRYSTRSSTSGRCFTEKMRVVHLCGIARHGGRVGQPSRAARMEISAFSAPRIARVWEEAAAGMLEWSR